MSNNFLFSSRSLFLPHAAPFLGGNAARLRRYRQALETLVFQGPHLRMVLMTKKAMRMKVTSIWMKALVDKMQDTGCVAFPACAWKVESFSSSQDVQVKDVIWCIFFTYFSSLYFLWVFYPIFHHLSFVRSRSYEWFFLFLSFFSTFPSLTFFQIFCYLKMVVLCVH